MSQTDSPSDPRDKLLDVSSPTLKLIAALLTMGLLSAHFQSGADTFPITVPFLIFFSVLFLIAAMVDGLRSVTFSMAIIAGLFLAWLSLGLFGNWHQAKYEVHTLVTAGMVLMTGYMCGARNGTLKFAWNTLVWTLLFFTLVSAFEYLSASGHAVSYGQRLSAGFGSPNSAATLFSISLLVGSAKLLVRFQDAEYSKRPRGERIAFLAQTEFASFLLIMFAMGCLILTVSRAGILMGLCAFIGLVGFELARMSKRGHVQFLRERGTLTGIGLVIIFLLFLAVTGDINPNHAEDLLQNLDGRANAYSIYVSIWLEKPWFGHGLGSFNIANDAATTIENAGALVPMGAAHNVVLQWLIQQGVVGLGLMTLILGMVFYPMIMALRASSAKPRNFLRLTIAVSLLVFGHGMVDYALEIPSIMWTYAFILGLAAGYAKQTRVRKLNSAV